MRVLLRKTTVEKRSRKVATSASYNPRLKQPYADKNLIHLWLFKYVETCNTILLLGDVKSGNWQLANIFLIYQTFITNLHLLRVELRCKLQEKLHCACDRVFRIFYCFL